MEFPGRITVLVVDSHEDTLVSLKSALEPHYTVLCATDSRQAEAIAETHSFDILLCEPVLKKGSAAVLLQRLARIRSFHAVAMSASGFSQQREHYFKSGFTHFLLKPFTDEQLIEMIRKVTR